MKTLILKLITFLIHLPFSPSSPPPTPTTFLSVTDFGAIGDGVNYDTSSIQSAINSCPPTTSCHVTFPSGLTFLTSTIHLNKSNVVLSIQPGATLLGGTRLEDYHTTDRDKWYVILAENVSGVGITGGGIVDGQGLKFVERFSEEKNVMVSWNWTGACLGDECRPRLVGFVGCKDVRVWNVTLRNPAYWCLHLVRCGNSLIRDVSIYGDFNSPNNDGIDIEGSNDTFITRCRIDTGDDAVCPKTLTGPVYNLTVSDCWIRTKSSAIKLGSDSRFEFRGLVFDRITIVDSHRGLGLQIRDGGNVSDVTFSNINISTRYYHPSWWGRSEPVYVTTCPRFTDSAVGSISNLSFVNITATSENGIFLSGFRDSPLQSLRFVNMTLNYMRSTNYAGGLADYRPGCQGLVNHSMAGIIMEHIDGLAVENVHMRWWSDNLSEPWDNPLNFRPSTVYNISLLSFHSGLFKQ